MPDETHRKKKKKIMCFIALAIPVTTLMLFTSHDKPVQNLNC